MVAHTGYARACPLVFSRVLLELSSWFYCSCCVANSCCSSPVLLYGLLYCCVVSTEIGRVELSKRLFQVAWLLRRFSCEFCPMVSSIVNLGGMVLPSVLTALANSLRAF